ncbi:MAG: hypothetical protein ACREFR_14500 [Limisphaerales bacterium]
MNTITILVKSAPTGDFEEASIHMPDCGARFLKLIQERKPIKYDVATMPNLSKEIQDELNGRYAHLILESDHDKHFLNPISK